MTRKQKTTDPVLRLYVTGFFWSVVLTVSAYVAVTQELLTGGELLAYITVLALLQVAVQLYYFLHLSSESKPRWSLWTLLFMSAVLSIIVIASLWIMHNLNYNMMPEMPAHEMDEHMMQESYKGF